MRPALAHARWELKLTLRNGEQFLLTLIIPLAFLIFMCVTTVIPVTDGLSRVATAYPVVCAVSIIATCFTSLAIGTGFERRSGALTFLATTPLGRQGLVLGKVIATIALAVLSIGVVTVAAVAFGWRPDPAAAWAIPVIALAGLAFASWALFLASALRAEAVLAIANGLFLVLILVGGVVVRPGSSATGDLISLLPSAALTSGLRDSLGEGIAPQWLSLGVLAVWAVIGFALARKRFRWQ